MIEHIRGFGQLAVLDGKRCARNDRRPVEIGDGGIQRTRHQRPGMASSHETGDVMTDLERRENLPGGRELSLDTDQGHGVVLAGVFARDMVETRRRHGRRLASRAAGMNAFDDVSFVVPEKSGDVIKLFGSVELNDLVFLGMVDVDDGEGESLAHLGTQHQAGAVHRVGKGQEKGQIVGAGVRLVGGKKNERLVRPFFDFQFGHCWPHALDVAAERVLEQVLAGAVEALFFGHLRPG
jgi:hypothetical protein